jgi:type IV pilus assembly protein PilN
MVKINLLSEGKRPAAVRKAKVPGALKLEGQEVGQWMLLAGILIWAVIFGFVMWNQKNKIEAKREEVAQAQREVEALAAVIKEVEDYKAKKAELERKIGIINDLKANQRGPVRVMDYVSRALPELLWLDRLRVSGDSIQITGRAFNTNAVANFIENLDKVPEFDEPTLEGTEEQGGGVYRFTINFKYSFAKPKEPGAEGAAPGTPATAGAGAAAPATSG